MSYLYPSQMIFTVVWGPVIQTGLLLDLSLPDQKYLEVCPPQTFPTWGKFAGVDVDGPEVTIADGVRAVARFERQSPQGVNAVLAAWRQAMGIGLNAGLEYARDNGPAIVNISTTHYKVF